jgi:repressor of nif and glnA expression
MDFQAKFDEMKVQAVDLVEKVKELLHETNIRRIIIRDEKGNTFMEIPISIAAVGAVVAPLLAALGTLAALVARFTVVVERTGANEKPEPDGPAAP